MHQPRTTKDPGPAAADRILVMTEISELTHVPVATLRFWRTNGSGPRMFKLGGKVVAKESDVLAWIDQQYAATATGVA